jgi:hypothetical protein
MTIPEELEMFAAEYEHQPLEICGYSVDKSNPRELLGALCWIEQQLGYLLKDEQERRARD